MISEEDDQELLEFQKREGIPQRVKERAEIIRLNHHGWSVAAIAAVSTEVTSYSQNKFHRWSNQGMSGLWSKRGRGRKRSWQEEDIKYLDICLEKDERTYDAAQLSQKLACIARSDFKQHSSQKSVQKAVRGDGETSTKHRELLAAKYQTRKVSSIHPRCGFHS